MKTAAQIGRKSTLTCFLLLSFLSGSLFAQQVIKFKNGNEFEVMIETLTVDSVKYQLVSEPQVTRVVSMDHVESIKAVDPATSTAKQKTWFAPPLPGQRIPPLEEALNRIKKAGNINGIGIGLGVLHQAAMVVNGGLPHGTDIERHNFIIGLLGAGIGGARLGLSIIPPIQLGKAEKAVLLLQQQPGNEGKYTKSLAGIRSAKHAATVVPALGFTSAMLLVIAYGSGWEGDKKHNGIDIAAWGMMGATLVTSVISSFLIADAKKTLLKESGSLSLGVTQHGVGLTYRLAGKR